MKIVLETAIFGLENLQREDGGCALIESIGTEGDEETGIFVRVQSWDETKEHKDFNALKGKRVRVTIEVVE